MTKKLELTPIGQPYPAEVVEDEINWHELLASLIEMRWLIAAVTFSAMAIGTLYAFLGSPVYRGDALVQVERKGSGLAGLDELSTKLGTENPANAEIEIIRSRSIVGAAVDQLGLDIVAKPRYFPGIGAAIARYRDSNVLIKPWRGLGQFAWGGERIRVQRFDVPRTFEEEPFTLVAGLDSSYTLYDPEGAFVLSGQVDRTARGVVKTSSLSGVSSNIEIFIEELRAHKETQFIITKKSRAQVINDLRATLEVTEKGNKTGILELALDGSSADHIRATLNAITNVYVRQNVERRSEESEGRLQFLNKQLPVLKAKLEAAEARLNEYRSKVGSIDLTLETQGILEQLAQLEKQMSALTLQRTELNQKFTQSHPAIITLNEKITQLERKRAELNRQIKSMPDETQKSIGLMRDVKVANELYLLLLNKAQELNVVKAGTVANVRIIDPAAVPSHPIKPQKIFVITMSTVLGLVLGIGIAFASKALRQGVQDPNELERELGLPVYASIPHSRKQDDLARLHKKNTRHSMLLAAREPNDVAVESVRSLRTSLQFALLDARNNIVSIAGPSFGVGKSFVSANLAYVLANAGKGTILLDADMRRGHLHDYFLTERGKGLSQIISGEITLQDATRKTDINKLRFLPSGAIPPNPSELLMSDRFQQLINELSKMYELVVIDTPPILAVTDAAIIGRMAGVNLILLRSGQHPMREIQQAIKRFEQNGIKPQGFIFNQVPPRTGLYGRYGYHYHYQYEYK